MAKENDINKVGKAKYIYFYTHLHLGKMAPF